MKVEEKLDPTFCYQSTFKNNDMLNSTVNGDASSSTSKSTVESTVNCSVRSARGVGGAREKKKVML
jgi:hypothetical protein